jgi:ribonuclease P protein component
MDKQHTLKKNSDFRRLYARGKSSVNPYLVVYSKKNGMNHNRIGFTVSAKLGNAVIRNRIRRQLREIYRLHLCELKNGIDLIIVARSRCVRGEYQKMDTAFITACRELNLPERDHTAI